MGEEPTAPFIGSEAIASGVLTRYELRRYYTALMPNVYLGKQVIPSLPQRAAAAWLWSGREGVIAGAAASALHGSKWVDHDAAVELIWRNARSPRGVVTRDELLLDGEFQKLDGLPVTTADRTAFDLGRRGPVGVAVARLDALAAAAGFKVCDVESLGRNHRHARGIRRLASVLDLVDAGAQSPRETQLRLLLIRAGFPRPRTQIPVLSSDGSHWYYLDMGWEDIKLAVEYDGDHHRVDPIVFAYDVRRLEDLHRIGWTVVRVTARHPSHEVIARTRRAWDAAVAARAANTVDSALTARATRTSAPWTQSQRLQRRVS